MNSVRVISFSLLLFLAPACKKAEPRPQIAGKKPAAVVPGNQESGSKTDGPKTDTSQPNSVNSNPNSNGKREDQPDDTNRNPTPTDGVETGDLNVTWIHGAASCKNSKDPPIQVHTYNKNLSILRQNKCLDYEGPFLYLVFGTEKALLLDTGATDSATTFPLRKTVEDLINEHYGAANRGKIQLIVAHSHAHGDHTAGDSQFDGKASTTLVGLSPTAVAKFFKISDWPNQLVDFDLGGRILKIIPLPGHEASHIAIYDAQTGILFSGDSLYPGRLYVSDWDDYRASISRLNEFMKGKVVTNILGAHIEMTKTAGKDYPIGSTYQPDEHPLPLFQNDLNLLDSELKAIGSTPKRKVLDDFIIDP